MTSSVQLDTVKRAVNETLTVLLQSRQKEAFRINESYGELWSHASETVLAGGKRIRPYLVTVGYGKVSEKILKVACAFELLHSAMLIHDDVIDRDTVRHGRLNVNGVYEKKYAAHTDSATAYHHSQSAAILGGDLLLSEAYHLIGTAGLTEEVYARVLGSFHQAIFDVVGGELLDVEAGFMDGYDPITIAHFKTAVYSFVAPLCSGAYCRSAQPTEIQLLTDFGLNIGIAFQLQDDLIGLFGDESKSGKSNVSDLQEGKKTALIEEFFSRITSEDRTKFLEHFGSNEAAEEELNIMKQAIAQSGAIDAIKELFESYLQKAEQAVDSLEDDVLQGRLTELMNTLRTRRA